MDTKNIQAAIFPPLDYEKALFTLLLGGDVFVYSNDCYWKISEMVENNNGGIIVLVERTTTELLNFTKVALDSGWAAVNVEATGFVRKLVRETKMYMSREMAIEEKIKLFSHGTFQDLSAAAGSYCVHLIEVGVDGWVADILSAKGF